MEQAEDTVRQKVIRQEQQRIMQEEMNEIVNGAGKGFMKGAISGGMLIGMALAVMWIPFVGAIMAFFLILSGIAAPFVSGIMGAEQGAGKGSKRVIHGKCPYCSGRLGITVAADDLDKYVGLDCPLCRKRFLTKGKAFLQVPPSTIKAESRPASSQI